MKIKEVIDEYKKIKKGQFFADYQLIRWLSELDGKVYNDIIRTHADNGNITFTPYDAFAETFNTDITLLVPEPYSEIYIHYLINQADYYLNESARYENSRKMFTNAFERYENYYNSKHSPAIEYRINI